MEFLNKVELRGRVGRVSVGQVGPFKRVSFAVCTEYAIRTKDGSLVVETNWNRVTAFAGNPDTEGVENLATGDAVFVAGRLRNNHYIDSDGSKRDIIEVLAHKVKKEE